VSQMRIIGRFSSALAGMGFFLAQMTGASANDIDPSGELVAIPTAKPKLTVNITDEELKNLKKAFKEADRRKWSSATKWAKKIKSPVPEKIVRWRYYLTETSGIQFDEIVRFIEANPDWPRRERLLRRAEEAMPDDLKPERVITWFAGQEPMTGEGKIKLGEAYLTIGKQEFGAYWLQNAWTEHNLSSRLQKRLSGKHKAILTQENHRQRAEMLLWQRKTSDAQRLIPLLKKNDAAIVRARIDLINRGSIKSAMSKVPSSQKNDGGLLYEQVKLHRKAERNSSALQVIRKAPTDAEGLGNPNLWWKERNLLARRAIKQELYDDAYDIVADNGLEFGGGFADAEFMAGWLALRYLNDPNAAEEHFRRLDNGVSYPISKSRAAYWLGRALEDQNKPKRAADEYQRAAAYTTTFYGQLAIERLQGSDAELTLPQYVRITAAELEQIASREIIEALQLLHIAEQDRTLRTFVFHLADYLETPEDYAALSDLMFQQDRPELGVRSAKKAALKHVFLPERAYPINAIDDKTIQSVKSPIELVLGLSRQESEFNPRAVSHAGALGLMQLMPGTAKIVARQHKLSYSKSRLTSDPSYNVSLGSAHLADLLDDWRGSYILTTASYNAGPHRAKTWIREYGDPRDAKKVDPIDWVEKIPFNETRNYVQRVLENMQVYRSRLAGASTPLRLSYDLGTVPPAKPLQYAVAPEVTTDDGKTEIEVFEEVAGLNPEETQTVEVTTTPPATGVVLQQADQAKLPDEQDAIAALIDAQDIPLKPVKSQPTAIENVTPLGRLAYASDRPSTPPNRITAEIIESGQAEMPGEIEDVSVAPEIIRPNDTSLTTQKPTGSIIQPNIITPRTSVEASSDQ